MIELAEESAKFCLVGMILADADRGESIEHPELLFAEPLVDDEGVRILAHSRCLDDQPSGMPRTQIWRRQHDVGPPLGGERAEPAAEGECLALAQLGKRDIDIPDVDVDHRLPRLERCFACDITRRLTMPRYVQKVRPDLIGLHARLKVKERTNSRRRLMVQTL